MNFFFGFKKDEYTSELQIPKFQNKNYKDKKINLFKANISNNLWEINKVINIDEDDNFYYLKNKLIDNKVIYFLAKDHEIENNTEKKLLRYNKFTETSPAFRSNFLVKKINGGFSSYQSEYPFDMIAKNGIVTSGVASLTNKNANKNYIIFRNIFIDPIERSFDIFFINLKNRQIIKKDILHTNRTNIIEIGKELLQPEIYFITKNYLGIPIYLSEKDGHLSLEHTHPPHEYFMSKNKFRIVKEFKNEINKIIS